MRARQRLGQVLLILSIAVPAWALPSDLTPEQAADVDFLIHGLMAPCCWTSSVAEHGSGQAPVVEADVIDRVRRGESRQEILDAYIAQYGERILAEPRAKGFNQLAYLVPWIAVVVGGLIIWRYSRRGADGPVTTGAATAPPLSRRIQDELARLDD